MYVVVVVVVFVVVFVLPFVFCFFQGGNLLLLDEPTNDLDVDTLRALEEAIDDYPGCAVIVSHDRYFLDKVATHTLAFEDDGGVVSMLGLLGLGNTKGVLNYWYRLL